MTEVEYVLCKWEEQLWPAKGRCEDKGEGGAMKAISSSLEEERSTKNKNNSDTVVSRSRTSRRHLVPPDKAASLCVKILGLGKQVHVSCAQAEPLKKESIERIASQLDECKRHYNAVKELSYRHALRAALDILNQESSFREGSPCKEGDVKMTIPRKAKDKAMASLLTSETGSPTKKRKGEACNRLTKCPNAPVEAKSKERGHECSSEKRSTSRNRLSNGRQQGQHLCISQAQMSVTHSEDDQLKWLPDSVADWETLHSPKDAGSRRQGNEESGRESASPLPAFSRLVRTSTPTQHGTGRQTPQEGAKPAPRRKLLSPRVKCKISNRAASSVSARGETPPKEMIKVSGEEPTGAGHKRAYTASCVCRERRRRSCPADFSSGGSRDEPVSENRDGEARNTSANTAKDFQLQVGEDAEGLESTSALSLQSSPVRETSLSSAYRDEEEEEEEEEKLPSILLHQEPCSIEARMLVWCKLLKHPYWPAVVTRVKRKAKKAGVVFVEKRLDDKKSKGFSTSLRNLKHFDCEEKEMLIAKARENYEQEINWCINLIADYRIRVGCHSFTGSFLEYIASDMSYPVRKEACCPLSQMTFPHTEETDLKGSLSEETPTTPAKKVLPDRTRAARDKANEKIVEFIVKTKGADEHLQAILTSQKPSRWLKGFLHPTPCVMLIETYLEDEGQQELVVNHLEKVYQEAAAKPLPLFNGESVILDVLFPEAIIYAISAVDHIDYKKAEEKYVQGPSVSHREREIFEEEILAKRRRNLQKEMLPSKDNV